MVGVRSPWDTASPPPPFFLTPPPKTMGSTYQSIVVPAPASAVWQTLRDFHDLSWAPDVVESCEAVGDHASTQPGAQRVLNDAFHETLHAVNDVDRVLKYSIDDGPSPVSKDEVSGYV